MNKIDLENIKKELAKRKAANYEWKDGGEMTKDDVMLRTTKELNELITTFNDESKNKLRSKSIKFLKNGVKKMTI